MGTTPGGLPYPDGPDPVDGIPDYFQELAEAADTMWALARRAAVQSIPDGVQTDIVWDPASCDLHPDFALTTGDTRIEYNGTRTRFFVYKYWVEWPGQSTALRIAGVNPIGAWPGIGNTSTVDLAVPAFTTVRNDLVGIISLDPGDTIQTHLFQTTGSSKNAQPEFQIAALA